MMHPVKHMPKGAAKGSHGFGMAKSIWTCQGCGMIQPAAKTHCNNCGVSLPHIVHFSSDTHLVELGQAIRLSWEVEDAQYVIIQPGDEVVAAQGMMDIYPQESIEYSLTAWTEAGQCTETISLYLPAPKIRSFETTEKNINVDYPTIFHWEVENGAQLHIDRGVGDVSGQSFTEAFINEPGTYTLTVSNATGQCTAQVELTLPLPEIGVFYAANETVHLGEETTLYWDVENATSVRLLPEGRDLSGKSRTEVLPDRTSTYTLEAQNASGVVRRNLTLVLPPPVINYFEGSSELSTEGEKIALSWSVENAYEVTINEGIGLVESEGTIWVKPQEAYTDYILMAKGHSGECSQSFTLTLFPLPIDISVLSPSPYFFEEMEEKNQEIPASPMPSLEDMEKEIARRNQNHLRHLHIQRVQEMELTQELLAMEKASVRSEFKGFWQRLKNKFRTNQNK